MASLRQTLFSLCVPAALVACGGGDDGISPPSGPTYDFVVSQVTVPRNNSEARDIGLDLNDDDSIDNQLGMVLGTLAGQGFDVQGTLDEAVDDGSIVLLLGLQTPSFASTTGAGLDIRLGDPDTIMPAPCNAATPPVCGLHLAGTGSFQVDPSSPPNAGVDGKIAGGVFSGGPGTISLQIALGGSEPIALDLIGARAKASGLREDGLDEVILAGALTQTDLDTKVIPAIHAQLGPIITEDCTGTAPPDPCGCMANSTGKTIIGLFDTDPKDCSVSIDEIKTNSLIMSLLSPDVEIDGQDALSLGLSVTGVKATIR